MQLDLRLIVALFLLFFLQHPITAQEQNAPRITGNLETNANFFIRDSLIGAANTPQYDRQKYGAEAWLNLNYSNWGFDFGLRFDIFNNSNLLNPTDSYSDQGIGNWFVRKQLNKLDITAGYIYDQIGSGIIFRAYEERPLLIDNALIGLRLGYQFSDNWSIKGFTGRQKQQFDDYESTIKGVNIEGFLTGKEESSTWSIAPGLGIVNRTLDDESMNALVAAINTYTIEDAFVPKYNTYAVSLYNTLTAGNLNWYIEGAYKTEDAINDPFAEIMVGDDTVIGDRFISESGTVLYTSLSYATTGLGVTLEAKRTEHFSLRTRPQAQLNRGMVNFLPPMTRVNTYRLTSRYNAATQELGELALQADIQYSPVRNIDFNLNASNITDLDNELLYREFLLSGTYKKPREYTLKAGIQLQRYNQEIYEFKPGVPIVETLTPFIDYLYKFDRRSALRIEAQYMHTGKGDDGERHDYGNWIFGLMELTLAPKWAFTVSDMYNSKPGKNSPVDKDGNKQALHYPRVDVFYTQNATRFGLSYVKQVEGVVCTGGICRLEPAFSGVKFSVNTSF